MSTFSNREFLAAVVDELSIVIGALIDSPPMVMPGAPAPGAGWCIEVAADGPLTGRVTFALDQDGASNITRLMMGIEGECAEEAVLDTLREVASQAISALGLKPVAQGAKLTVDKVGPVPTVLPSGDWAVNSVSAEKLPTPLTITVWGTMAAAQKQEPAAKAAAAAPAPAPASRTEPPAAPRSDERIDVILDIDLPLIVRFGRTELPLRSLTRIGLGSVIDLQRSPDDPVEVLVGNRVVARGEVVIVSGNYGIRVLDVVSPRERVRSMEG